MKTRLQTLFILLRTHVCYACRRANGRARTQGRAPGCKSAQGCEKSQGEKEKGGWGYENALQRHFLLPIVLQRLNNLT
jgi:hypothetical protein